MPPLPLEAPRASLLTLTLAPPGEPPRSHPYLSGTFPLTPTPALAPLAIVASLALSSETHAFAEVATALEDLLRYLAVGIDHLREAWVGKNGGGTATREWITSIEEVLRQHGEDGDVRRALGDLLMTGRPGEGLMNFLGGRLTPRVRPIQKTVPVVPPADDCGHDGLDSVRPSAGGSRPYSGH